MATALDAVLFFDAMVSRLETYAAAEPTADQFAVEADRFRDFPRPTDSETHAYAFPHMGPTSVENEAGAHKEFETTYYVDLVVIASGSRSGSTSTAASTAAGVRLRYLKAQALEALFPSGDRFFGMDGTAIGSKKLVQIEPYLPESETSERIVLGARMTITATSGWDPPEQSGVDLESISADVGMTDALIEP